MGNEAEGRITRIGQHRVRHGNIYEREEMDRFIGDDRADLFYSDPPWGTGNLKFWDTTNKKMNADAKDYDYGFDVDKFLDVVIGSAVRYTDGFVVIEYGKRWVEKLVAQADQKGLFYCNRVETLYKGGGKLLPLDVVVFHTRRGMSIPLLNAYHTVGYKTVKTVFSILRPMIGAHTPIGMDLCCGMGFTAQACIDSGMRFIGNELNVKRLQKTIDRLKQAEGRNGSC